MKRFRKIVRTRFSLWALLVLITVIAIPLGYVAQRRAWNLRRKAVERLEKPAIALEAFT